jgi:hypothetical protein
MKDERDRGVTGTCAVCGEELDAENARTYAVSPSAAICHECACHRGGVYDSELERWRIEPDVSSLPRRWDYEA